MPPSGVPPPARAAPVGGPAFVTGGAGFVGRHLVASLDGPVLAPPKSELDLRDAEAVRRALAAARPGRVFHLAARASVGRSWEDPRSAILDNLETTFNLLEAVRTEAPAAAVVVACSGEEYGRPARLPLDERAPLAPQSPYAVSKAACDLLAGQYAASHRLRVVRTRAFNHAGPGQSDDYVVGTLTRQVAQAEAAGAVEAEVRTGNPDSSRDFTDVRDVVRAYVLAADALEPGAYNVCSGRAVSVRELVELVRSAGRIPVRHELDPARLRAGDVPEVRGSAERLRAAAGWTPAIPIATTVADALDHWRRVL